MKHFPVIWWLCFLFWAISNNVEISNLIHISLYIHSDISTGYVLRSRSGWANIYILFTWRCFLKVLLTFLPIIYESTLFLRKGTRFCCSFLPVWWIYVDIYTHTYICVCIYKLWYFIVSWASFIHQLTI